MSLVFQQTPKEHGELSRNDAIEAVIQKMDISDDQMSITQESNGKPSFEAELAGRYALL